MGLVIIAVLIGVPLIEIAVFIEVGDRIGLWPTIAVVVATAVAGGTMLRHQGMSVLARAQKAMERQEFPVAEIVDGICLLFAGALLLTPGFVTDALGFVLMVPGLRNALVRPVWRYLAAHGSVRGGFTRHGGGADRKGPGAGPGDIIDGEYREVRPHDGPQDGPQNGPRNGPRNGPHGGGDGPGKSLPRGEADENR